MSDRTFSGIQKTIHGYVRRIKNVIKDTGKTILIRGTADKIVSIRYAREAAGCYPHCSYHEIFGGGHMFRGKYDREAVRILKAEMK